MSEEQKIIYPFGWLAGHEGGLHEVLEALALEMLGHRADLQAAAWRIPDKAGRDALTQQAEELEKYAVILNVVFIQMRPDQWHPEHMGGLLELAEKHGVTLPDWMKA